MRNHLKRTLSTALAVALLGCAVMLSVSVAKGPYRQAGENAFDGSPVGHQDKALTVAAWIDESAALQSATNEGAFDWGMECPDGCPKCGFKDSQVTPVVLDMPELLGGSDEASIEMIKRKLGINAFRGSIFDGPQAPTAQLLKHHAPAELKTFDCVLETLTASDGAKSTCGVECLASQATVYTTPAECVGTCTAACKSNSVAANVVRASDCALTPVATAEDESELSAGFALVPMSSDRVERLRLFSPGLDEIANKLEEIDLYDEADSIRETAQRLRLKARELKTGATAGVAPRPWKPISASTASCDCCKNQCGGDCKCSKATSSGEQRASATQAHQVEHLFDLLRNDGQ